VTAVLKSRGVQAADVDDIVQEAAIRALRQLDRFMSQEHLVRWCCRVAINAHIDAVRRSRRLVAPSSEDAPAPVNVAETVEGRLALDAALAEVAGLSEEDRALLLDPPAAVDRKDAVRLAVRRHRLRARLANALEGVLAGIPVLRRLHPDSMRVQAVAFAVPVIAALSVVPLIAGYQPWHGDGVQQGRPALQTVARATRARPTHSARGAGSSVPASRGAVPNATSSHVYVEVAPAGTPVFVRRDDKAPGDPFVCLNGYVNHCADRPGPELPLPPLPIPGGSGPSS
jgi:RNA polymerase sigma factor (sigma-70 family)